MTVVKDVSSSVFEGRRSSAEVTSEGKPFHSRLEVQTRFLTVFWTRAPDDQFVTRRRSESLTWVIVDCQSQCPLQVSRQVFWCRAIGTAEPELTMGHGSNKWVNKFGWVTWVTGQCPWPVDGHHVIFRFMENQQRQSKLLFWLSVSTFSHSL